VSIFIFKDAKTQLANKAYSLLLQLQKDVKEVLQDELDFHFNEVNVIIGSSDKIKELNNKYREVDETTDVLAFSFDEGDLTGEIWLNPAIIQDNAKEFEISFQEELLRILVHGMLHVAGYDHEHKFDFNKTNQEEMFQLQEQILSKIG
jgi:probable rRNA maturation factor